jgi:transcriptional regulator with XRE-family HTH domain
VSAFGRRVLRERTARRWSLRELGDKSGVPFATISRAERGQDVMLASAMRIADALSVPIGDLVTPSSCETCDGLPPSGFTCNECGKVGQP